MSAVKAQLFKLELLFDPVFMPSLKAYYDKTNERELSAKSIATSKSVMKKDNVIQTKTLNLRTFVNYLIDC